MEIRPEAEEDEASISFIIKTAFALHTGLEQLRGLGIRVCTVLGDPAFYGRFGFVARRALRLAGAPAAHFMALTFGEDWPEGDVEYHPIFAVWA